MQYNEKAFMTLLSGKELAIEASDRAAIVSAIRRRLWQQKKTAQDLGLTIPDYSIKCVKSRNSESLVISLVKRKVPQFSIHIEDAEDDSPSSAEQ